MPALGREKHFRLSLEHNVASLAFDIADRIARDGHPTRCGMLT